MRGKNLRRLIELIQLQKQLEYHLTNEEYYIFEQDNKGAWNKIVLSGSSKGVHQT